MKTERIFSLTLVTLNLLLLRLPQDMDLCCLLDVKSSQMAPSALVQTLGELLKQGKRCGSLFQCVDDAETDTLFRDEIRCKASSQCANPNHQALSQPLC